MDNKESILIILVLFILLGLAYSPLKKAGLNKSSNNGEVASASVEATNTNLGYTTNKNVAAAIKSTEKDIKKLEEDLDKKIEESRRSPYYGKITLSGISGLYGDDPNQEYFSLYTNLKENETVKITGWYLKSEVTGYSVIIGGASVLPFPSARTEKDVVLEQGDGAIITKGFSPIGISFRTNKCTGYFEENRTFTPSLSLQCPLAKDEKLPNFSSIYDRNDECLNIIENIPRCATRDSEFIRDLPDTVSESCKSYMTKQINYNYCVVKHFGDTDFPGDEYRLYLNKFGPLWRQKHDKINLHDENGLVVDTISY